MDIKLPYTTIQGIWKKAVTLVTEANAPGFSPQDRMVKSKSGFAPHLVTVSVGKGGVQN